ncbi:Alpha/Beta hydrolase protein [Lipomyces starkeyi]
MLKLISVTKALTLLLSIQFATSAPLCLSNILEVGTTSGILRGIINGTTPDVRQFLGVPFAQAPVGDLRWMPPVAVPSESSSRYIDASKFSMSCSQYESTIPSVYNKFVREFFIQGPSGEDCLTLSIWAPARDSHKLLPVFIYIYGGGLQTGGSSVPYQDPAQWIQRTQSHIVVSIQYRLNIFGFPNAKGLDSQNLGYLDQRAAIEWLQVNIAAFGGDPYKMVLWGQSAGALSTDVQNFAFPDNPIVSGFICDSAAAESPVNSDDYSQSNFTFVAEHFNCSGDSMLPCMRNISSTDIIAFLASYQDSQVCPALSFVAIPDEVVVFSNYTQRMIDGQFSTAPAIFGSNELDGVSLVSLPADPYTMGPNMTAAEDTLLDIIFCPDMTTADLRTKAGRTTFRYQYQGNFTNISPLFWMGAYHSSELPMIFGTSGDFRGPATEFEKATSRMMQDLWLAFANDPLHGVEKLNWPNVTSGYVNAFGGADETARLISAATLDAPCLKRYGGA